MPERRSEKGRPRAADPRRRSRIRAAIGIAILGVLVLSVAARAVWPANDGAAAEPPVEAGDEAGSRTAPPWGTSLLPGEPRPGTRPPASSPPADQPREGVAGSLPVVTEASFFALMGFALGYATRKVIKLGLILLAGLFVVVQGLSFAGVVQVDWDRALELANGLVMNLRGEQSWKEVLTGRIPSAGALAGGYLLGFRKG